MDSNNGGYLISIKTEPEDCLDWSHNEQTLEEEDNIKEESCTLEEEKRHVTAMKREAEDLNCPAEEIFHQIVGDLKEDVEHSKEEHFDISINIKMEDAILEEDEDKREERERDQTEEDGDSGIDMKANREIGLTTEMVKKEPQDSLQESSDSEECFATETNDEECSEPSHKERDSQTLMTPQLVQKCHVCGAVFHEELSDSSQKSKNSFQKAPICKVCDQMSAESPGTIRRNKSWSSDNVLKLTGGCRKKVSKVRSGKVRERGIQNNFRCKFCKKVIPGKETMNVHYLHHCAKNPFKCQYCGEVFTTTQKLKKHEKSHAGELSFTCRYCDKTFERCDQMRHHEKRHFRSSTGGKPYKCKVCSSGFKRLFDMKIHEKIHFVGKTYKCQFCDQSFVRKNTLKRHEQVHTGEKPFKCQICKKGFPRPYNLKTHEYTHSGLKLFQCKICGKRYSQRDVLRCHEKAHRYKPFKCRYCDDLFSMKDEQINHEEQFHSKERPHECKVCLKRFKVESDLVCHKRLHSDKRTFQCMLCDKKYTRSYHLRRHEITHTGERPFKCNHCDKGFTRKCGLKVHMRTHKNHNET